jgi:hypothetical protein
MIEFSDSLHSKRNWPRLGDDARDLQPRMRLREILGDFVLQVLVYFHPGHLVPRLPGSNVPANRVVEERSYGRDAASRSAATLLPHDSPTGGVLALTNE